MGSELFRPNIMLISTGSVTLSKVLLTSDLYPAHSNPKLTWASEFLQDPLRDVEFGALGPV